VSDGADRTLASTLLHLLGDENWAGLRARMRQTTFERGDVIVSQGTLEPPFHVIVDGVASVVASSPRGEERELGRLGFGECIGEMSLLTGEPASASVVALGSVTTYSATPGELANLAELRSRLIESLSAILAARLKDANDRLLRLHAARTHIICCSAPDVPALAHLPDAIARTTGGSVLVLPLTGETHGIEQSPHVAVRPVDAADRATLPMLMHRASGDFDHILLLADERDVHQYAAEATSLLHVVRIEGGSAAASGHQSSGPLIAICDEEPTRPVLRRLSDDLGRPVVATVPAASRAAGPHDPVSYLARVLTNRRVGLALGAGAAKGLAHLGVLRALEEMDVPIDVVAGCSIGAPIAAGVAARMDRDELTARVIAAAARAVRPAFPLHSFLSNAGVKEEIRRLAEDRCIEDLDRPLGVVAVDLFRRSEVTFTSGLVWPRLVASMAIPGIYPPSPGLGSYLVDGGVLTPVPVRQCRELGAGIVIGVRLTGRGTSPRESLDFKPAKPLAIETIMRTFEIMLNRISEASSEHTDVPIDVLVEGDGGVRDFRRGDEISEVGYQAAIAATPALTEALPYLKAAAR
jgi:NTE family protein